MIKIETSTRDIDESRTSCLVVVRLDDNKLVSSSVVNQPMKVAAQECLQKLQDLIDEVKIKMAKAGIL